MRHFEEHYKEYQEDIQFAGQVYMVTFLVAWTCEEVADTYWVQGYQENYLSYIEIESIYNLETEEEILPEEIVYKHLESVIKIEANKYMEL